MAIATNASSDAVAIVPTRVSTGTPIAVSTTLASMPLETDALAVVPVAIIQKDHEAIMQPVWGQLQRTP